MNSEHYWLPELLECSSISEMGNTVGSVPVRYNDQIIRDLAKTSGLCESEVSQQLFLKILKYVREALLIETKQNLGTTLTYLGVFF